MEKFIVKRHEEKLGTKYYVVVPPGNITKEELDIIMNQAFAYSQRETADYANLSDEELEKKWDYIKSKYYNPNIQTFKKIAEYRAKGNGDEMFEYYLNLKGFLVGEYQYIDIKYEFEW